MQNNLLRQYIEAKMVDSFKSMFNKYKDWDLQMESFVRYN